MHQMSPMCEAQCAGKVMWSCDHFVSASTCVDNLIIIVWLRAETNDSVLFINVPADGLASNSARPSHMVMTSEL